MRCFDWGFADTFLIVGCKHLPKFYHPDKFQTASMKKYLLLIALPFLTIVCTERTNKVEREHKTDKENTFRMYSKNVSDTFSISINLPNDYNEQTSNKYPVVYLLDANLYFDIVATTLNKYSDVGLAPSVILVGIGYKDFPTMDSLRTRDDTYPTAIPE